MALYSLSPLTCMKMPNFDNYVQEKKQNKKTQLQ